MTIAPRLVVVGHDRQGRSVVHTDRVDEPITVRAFPGQEFHLLWGSPDGGAVVGTEPSPPVVLPFFAGEGGSRLLFVRFPPLASVTSPSGDPEELAAEVDTRLPGLAEVFLPEDPTGMHTTDTLDYGVCLEGELWLAVDEGPDVHLTPGTCVVQQGTRHAWNNRGTAPALMCFVGLGARRAD